MNAWIYCVTTLTRPILSHTFKTIPIRLCIFVCCIFLWYLVIDSNWSWNIHTCLWFDYFWGNCCCCVHWDIFWINIYCVYYIVLQLEELKYWYARVYLSVATDITWRRHILSDLIEILFLARQQEATSKYYFFQIGTNLIK